MHAENFSAQLHRLNWLLRAGVVEAKLRDLERAVENFVKLCLAQDEALLDGEVARFNRLFDKMRDVVEELRAGGHTSRFVSTVPSARSYVSSLKRSSMSRWRYG